MAFDTSLTASSKSIVSGRVIARYAIRLAVSRIDRKHACNVGLERRAPIVQVFDRGTQRASLKAGRIDLERRCDLLSRFVAPACRRAPTRPGKPSPAGCAG